MSTIVLILLILLLIGALPAWPYSRGWGYYPSGGLGLILVIIDHPRVVGSNLKESQTTVINPPATTETKKEKTEVNISTSPRPVAAKNYA